MEKSPLLLKPLSPSEWDVLFDDFRHGGYRRDRWTSAGYTGLDFFELSLSVVLRRDFSLSLKLQLLVFLDEFLSVILVDFHEYSEKVFSRLMDTLGGLLQSPIDGVSVTYAIREQMMISITSIFVTFQFGNVSLCHSNIVQLGSLTELLLTVINRPNCGQDRQVRATACECLRELERAYPGLLSAIIGHLWGLCQSERTHASQSYVLLLASVIHSIVILKPNISIFNSSTPFLPFSVPQFLISNVDGSSKGISNSTQKWLKRVISFLLDCPHFFTPSGMMEFMWIILPLATALDLQPSLLKVQFSGLLYTFDPLLCHSNLMMYSHFLDSFVGQEAEIAHQLVSISRTSHNPLFFRLLALHWLMGFLGEDAKVTVVLHMGMGLYPCVYDPFALKILKLDLIAYCSILLDDPRSAEAVDDENPLKSAVSLLKDSVVSVSPFKWLPPWSTETVVAFRAMHKFLVGSLSHSDVDPSSASVLMESTIFCALQKMIVDLALEFRGLVPCIVVFIDRFLECHKHFGLGERLLQTFDKYLLPKLFINYQLVCYFPIFHMIAKNVTIPPCRLIELLNTYMIFLVEKHSPDTELKSWSHGSKVMCICRRMITYHYSSRLFIGLSRLLAFTCMYFPDLVVRDDARFYLRMLTCVPGKKLRLLLNSEGQLPGITPLDVSTPQPTHNPKKSRTISSYICIERITPLLVKQSWSLSLPSISAISTEKVPPFSESFKYSELEPESLSKTELELDVVQDAPFLSEREYLNESLHVMDSRTSRILKILWSHFSLFPDSRHAAGFKVRISCRLKFNAEVFSQIWAADSKNSNQQHALVAMYASVLSFSSSAPYGRIPSQHVPFLPGEPPRSNGDDIENGDEKYDRFQAIAVIELEPKEPTPGIIDVSIESNTENGQIVRGRLQSISVGIEDMFARAMVPPKTPHGAIPGYCMDLFSALWEACGSGSGSGSGSCSSAGRKTLFPLMIGTRSVKLLEIGAASMISAVERYLARFVVGVFGGSLCRSVKDRGIIKDVFWDDETDCLPIKSSQEDDEGVVSEKSDGYVGMNGKCWGGLLVLVFLPPRFHLLFRMEVFDFSTLVRIRTDHWPCLAYVDDYLEALVSTH